MSEAAERRSQARDFRWEELAKVAGVEVYYPSWARVTLESEEEGLSQAVSYVPESMLEAAASTLPGAALGVRLRLRLPRTVPERFQPAMKALLDRCEECLGRYKALGLRPDPESLPWREDWYIYASRSRGARLDERVLAELERAGFPRWLAEKAARRAARSPYDALRTVYAYIRDPVARARAREAIARAKNMRPDAIPEPA